MSNRFRDKLKAIRDASQRRNETALRARSDEEIHRSIQTVKSFEFRESVEAVIEELVTNFQGEAPGFVLTRGFFEGKYMLALRLDEQLLDQDGNLDSYYSRLMFLLDPHSEDGTFGIQCRKTIRNRDLDTTSHSGPMDESGMATFSEFIESQFVAFAEAYFADHALSRPGGDAAADDSPSEPAPGMDLTPT